MAVQMQTAIGLCLYELEKTKLWLEMLNLYGRNIYMTALLTEQKAEQLLEQIEVDLCNSTVKDYLAIENKPLTLSNN